MRKFQYVAICFIIILAKVLSANDDEGSTGKTEDQDTTEGDKQHQEEDENDQQQDSKNHGKGKSNKKRCCPYDFDSKICTVVNDRVLCGYNRNRGKPGCRERIKELGEGCRLRGGRVECRYVTPPYVNLRRPPPYDETTKPNDSEETSDATNKEHKDTSSETTTTEPPPVHNSQEKQCREVGDRIICTLR